MTVDAAPWSVSIAGDAASQKRDLYGLLWPEHGRECDPPATEVCGMGRRKCKRAPLRREGVWLNVEVSSREFERRDPSWWSSLFSPVLTRFPQYFPSTYEERDSGK